MVIDIQKIPFRDELHFLALQIFGPMQTHIFQKNRQSIAELFKNLLFASFYS